MKSPVLTQIIFNLESYALACNQLARDVEFDGMTLKEGKAKLKASGIYSADFEDVGYCKDFGICDGKTHLNMALNTGRKGSFASALESLASHLENVVSWHKVNFIDWDKSTSEQMLGCVEATLHWHKGEFVNPYRPANSYTHAVEVDGSIAFYCYDGRIADLLAEKINFLNVTAKAVPLKDAESYGKDESFIIPAKKRDALHKAKIELAIIPAMDATRNRFTKEAGNEVDHAVQLRTFNYAIVDSNHNIYCYCYTMSFVTELLTDWAEQGVNETLTVMDLPEPTKPVETGENMLTPDMLEAIYCPYKLMSSTELMQFMDKAHEDKDNVLCAVPYGFDLPAFYFSNDEEYTEKLKAAKRLDLMVNCCGDYEHEIEFIDGELGLWKAIEKLSIRNTVEAYEENLDWWQGLSESEQFVAEFLMSEGYITDSLDDLVDKMSEVHVSTNLEEWAYETSGVEEYGCDSVAYRYFNHKAYINDAECNGDIYEIGTIGTDRVYITNKNCL